MTHVIATASGGNIGCGVYNALSSPVMTNVTASAGGSNNDFGVYNSAASPIIKSSSISGITNSILNTQSSTAKVASGMLEGAVTGGGFTCVGVHDDNFVALDTSCQPI
jgi:hypothetical protein